MGERTNARDSAEGLSVLVLSTRPGSGQLCDACQQAIEPTHVECLTADRAHSSSESLRFHQWCYYAKMASNR